jgi:hypothetical protein
MRVEIIAGFIIIFIVAGWGVWYLRKEKSEINKSIFELIPNLFPTIGILGTFVGIAIGLWKFNEADPTSSIPELLNGLKTAFFVSIFGVLLLLVFSIYSSFQREKLGLLSDETEAINSLKECVIEMSKHLHHLEEGRTISTSNVLRDLYKESQKQTVSLASFSSDLAFSLSDVLNNPQEGVTHELRLLKKEIELLGQKLQDPATEMTQSVIGELQNSMASMVNDFKESMSGSAKSELEGLISALSVAGDSLTSFPSVLTTLSQNMQTDMNVLKITMEEVSRQTLSNSEESTSKMRSQIEDITNILSEKVGSMQSGQENLMNIQSENLKVSDQLVDRFNLSVENLDKISSSVLETLDKYRLAQTELNNVAGQLRSVSENVANSSRNLSESQTNLTQQVVRVADINSKSIEELKNTLVLAKNLSEEYSDNFSIIESGLKNIFAEIESGLKSYRTTVNGNLNEHLGTYTSSLTRTVDSLNSAFASQSDILNEQTELLNDLKNLISTINNR